VGSALVARADMGQGRPSLYGCFRAKRSFGNTNVEMIVLYQAPLRSTWPGIRPSSRTISCPS